MNGFNVVKGGVVARSVRGTFDSNHHHSKALCPVSGLQRLIVDRTEFGASFKAIENVIITEHDIDSYMCTPSALNQK